MEEAIKYWKKSSEKSTLWPPVLFSGVLPCEDRHGGLYPNVDLSIWLRSCLDEVVQPKKAWKLTGLIPTWLKVREICLKKLGPRYLRMCVWRIISVNWHQLSFKLQISWKSVFECWLCIVLLFFRVMFDCIQMALVKQF